MVGKVERWLCLEIDAGLMLRFWYQGDRKLSVVNTQEMLCISSR